MLFDSLSELKQTEKFKSVYNFSQSFELISFAVTIFLGGLLANVNLLLPILVHIVLLILSAIFSSLLTEPISTERGEEIEKSGYVNHVQTAITQVFSKSSFRNGLLGSFAALALTLAVFKSTKNILSPILDAYGFSVSVVGLIISSVILIKALGAFLAGKVSRKGNEINETRSALVICIIGLLTISFIRIPILQLLLFLALVSMDNLILSNLKTLINQSIKSSHRSTILSLSSLVARGSEMLYLTGFGLIIDSRSLYGVLLFTVAWLCLPLSALLLYRKIPKN